jgi:hypothetical protein
LDLSLPKILEDWLTCSQFKGDMRIPWENLACVFSSVSQSPVKDFSGGNAAFFGNHVGRLSWAQYHPQWSKKANGSPKNIFGTSLSRISPS